MGSKAPRVSVVIPVFDRREQVLDAIDSVLAQTYRDLHVLVVDDGSTDGTPDVIAARRPGVGLLRRPHNAGPAAARNAGLRMTAGQLVFFLDSDDQLLPGAIERHVTELDSDPGAVMSSSLLRQRGVRRTILPDEPPPPDLAALLLQLLTGRFAGLLSSSLIRRSAVEAIGGFDEDVPPSEDTDLFLRLAPRGRFAFIAERLTVRGMGADRISLRPRPGDLAWNRVLDKALGGPEGALLRPHVSRIRASRHARLFDRLSSQGMWKPSLRELRCALALDPLVLVRVPHLRRKLVPILYRAARHGISRSRRVGRAASVEKK
jgi:glycosyltransferase involved in cell wall biosynthesis